jgi:hypothetical protein
MYKMLDKYQISRYISLVEKVYHYTPTADHETGLPDAASRKVSIENTDEGSKAESVNSKMLGSPSFHGSCMIPVMTLCIVIFAESLAYACCTLCGA